jgi:putative ABC transport system permease protein
MLRGDLVVPLPRRPGGTLKVVARLRPGISPAVAAAAMDTAGADAHVAGSRPVSGWRSTVRPLRSIFVAEHVGRTLWVLFAIVVLLQLVAAVNASILMTLSAEAERRDVAIRLMLGARLREVVGESAARGALLAAAAAAAALLLVAWTRTSLVAMIPPSVPRLTQIDVNSGAVVFAALSACVVALAVAYGPTLVVSQTDPLATLRGGSRHTKTILSRAFVAAAAGLACVIMIAAVSFAQSLRQLTAQPLGFDPRGIVAFAVDAPNTKPFDWQRHEPVRRKVLAELEHATAVAAFAGSDMPPFSGLGAAYSFRTLDGVKGPAADSEVMIEHRRVTPGFFRTLRIPMLSGRDFDASDQPGAPPVAIVSELAARRFWPGTSPVGKRLLLTSGEEPVTVVGIVGDVRHVGFDREPVPQIYRPWLQEPRSGLVLLVRPAGSVGAFLDAMSGEQRPLARGAAIGRLRPLDTDLDRTVVQERFRAQLLLGFALLATLICAAGVIAVTAATIVRSRRELAIKMSLGADLGRLITAFTIGASVVPALAGVALAATLTGMGRPLLASFLPPGVFFGPSTVAIASAVILLGGSLSAAITSGVMVRRTPFALLRRD